MLPGVCLRLISRAHLQKTTYSQQRLWQHVFTKHTESPKQGKTRAGNSYHGETYQPKKKSQQKNNFSIFSQGSLAVTGSNLSTNCNHVSQKHTAILHTGMTILELVIFKNQTSASTAEFNLFYLWLSQFLKQLGCNCTGRHRQSLISLPTQQWAGYSSFLACLRPRGIARSLWFVAPEDYRSLRDVRSLHFPLDAHWIISKFTGKQTAAKESHCPQPRKAKSNDLNFRRDAKSLACKVRHHNPILRFIYFLVTKLASLNDIFPSPG